MDPSVPVEAEEVVHGTKKTIAHHTPEFDIHEGSLAVGAATWVALALHRLSPGGASGAASEAAGGRCHTSGAGQGRTIAKG